MKPFVATNPADSKTRTVAAASLRAFFDEPHL